MVGESLKNEQLNETGAGGVIGTVHKFQLLAKIGADGATGHK